MGKIKSKIKRLLESNQWGTVQFFHQQRKFAAFDGKRFTAAVDVPTKKKLLRLRDQFANGDHYKLQHPKLDIKFGKSKVNPKDQYVRQIGRDTAFSRIASHTFHLNKVEVTCGRTLFFFDSVVDNQRIQIAFVVTPNSDRAQLRHVLVRGLPSGLAEVIRKNKEMDNAESEEVSSGAQNQGSGSPIRTPVFHECGGD